MSEAYRSATDLERLMLLRLLEPQFAGRDALLSQIPDSLWETLDENGSVMIRPKSGELADIIWSVPVEAADVDLDGMPITVLLHVRTGRLFKIEIFRADNERIITPLNPTKWKLEVRGNG